MTKPGHGAAAVFAVIALALTLAGCSSGGSVEPIAQSPSETPTTTAASPFTTKGDDGQVKVVEKGLSATRKGAEELLSFGLVLENTNRKAVAFPKYAINLLDAAGKRLYEGEYDIDPPLSAPRILPGGRYGVGVTSSHPNPAKVADIRVVIIETEWVTSNDREQFAKLTAGPVRTERATASQRAAAETTSVTFTIDSAFSKPLLAVEMSAIFRNTARKIVGGARHLKRQDGMNSIHIPPGRSTHEMALEDDTPSSADDSRTEVYVFPFVFPPS
ncbi:hypothetical protein [Actinomadura sp. 6N118]|uniref:hypothetical protein n=1 Tax=Actinomadura sp. 6N118 TaxID=3375151 RepID=UPI0037B57BB1